jgi:tetratricopeptide (TPR) repeat protein
MMEDTIAYIESYFPQTLNSEERAVFETRCETDENFAKEVAFYIATRQVMREALLEQKAQAWKEEVAEEEYTPVIPIDKRRSFGKWIMYAAAACVLLAVSMFLFETQSSPQRLASDYIKKNYSTLSQEMSADSGIITKGMDAYNHGDYDKALNYFIVAKQRDTANSDVKKYTGISYFQKKNYDQALKEFDTLSNMQGLQSNPGDFLKAVTLLERNDQGDKDEAKKLLKKVQDENEEGSKDAGELSKKL